MPFTQRMAGLAAVVAVPLGIAATSYALTDTPEAPRVPPAVHLSTTPTPSGPPPSSGPATKPATESATPSGTHSGTPSGTGTASTPPPSDSVVPGPSATGDDDDDHE
ncbi:small hydrophilic protein [Streptomyces sp. NPDC091278]|uniref:small hydrophilic protein n=1 Tax=Streptomyces sp. NPDC091278 TaxID=3155301 RepID=UPI00344D3581